MTYLNADTRMSLEPLRDEIVQLFTAGDLNSIGLTTDCLDIIEGHGRLLRSLYWKDNDYPDAVFEVLIAIAKRDLKSVKFIKERIRNFQGTGQRNISSAPKQAEQAIVFTPSVFRVPDVPEVHDIVAVIVYYCKNIHR